MWVRCCCPDTPEEGIESHYRWLWATMWLLGTELRISEGTISGLNCWAISPAPEYINLKEREKLAEILLSLGLLVCGTMPRSIQGWWLNLELFLWWKSTIKPSPALNADYTPSSLSLQEGNWAVGMATRKQERDVSRTSCPVPSLYQVITITQNGWGCLTLGQ